MEQAQQQLQSIRKISVAAAPCSASESASFPVSSLLPPPLPSSHSAAYSPLPRPTFPQIPVALPSRTTSSTHAASPDPKPSRLPRSSPTSSPPPNPTPSSPSSAASASPAPMPPPSSPKTRSSSAPKWTKPWSLSSPGSPASVSRFRCRSIVPKLQYYLPLFGSSENLLRALKESPYILSSNLHSLVQPNVVFLQECGLGACDIAKLCVSVTRMLTTNPEHVRAMVACAERLGVPRGAGMFRHALQAVAFLSEEKIAAKMDYLKNTFRWSDAEVSIAVCRAPIVLRKSKESLKRRSEFLVCEVGLEPVYIAHRPNILSYSMEGRLRPRYYVIKFLKQNGLRDCDLSLYSAVNMTEKVFVEKLICLHKEAAPHLAEDYAVACKGELPTNFRFI